mmetsp:Transcript_20021/g.42745  ORF Transcript_20021/g.42745 Transcript_20021/m.42745 type:complete len:222 (-) Transcript_20021:98-763(-)
MASPTTIGAEGEALEAAEPLTAQASEQGAADSPSADVATPAVKAAPSASAEALELIRAQWDVLSDFAAPYVASYYAILRPWGEFFHLQQPNLGLDDFQSHVERNLAHFQANYLVLAVVILVATLLSHPARLIAAAIDVAAWAIYATRGGLNPDWRPKVAGAEMTSSHRLMVLSAGSLAVLFLVDGEAMLVLAGLLALLTTGHALFHPGVTVFVAASGLRAV